jgi:hypothetical protein
MGMKSSIRDMGQIMTHIDLTGVVEVLSGTVSLLDV